MISLSGKVALVTGASRGLGRAISLALADAGADVVVTDLLVEGETADADKLSGYGPLASLFAGTDNVRTESTAGEIKEKGKRSLALKMDVAQPSEIQGAIEEVRATLGPVDILVNNAAIMDNFALFENQDPKLWERDLRVNLSGAFHCAKAVWPDMAEKGWGRIVNISSIAGAMGAFGQPSYGASKAGLIGLTRSLAIEGAKKGITVNSVLPGLIETEAVKLHKPEMLERMRNSAAMKRLGRPEEVAFLVAFLASDQASYITGAAIPVAGGADLFIF